MTDTNVINSEKD